MSQISVDLSRMNVGGPYSYTIFRNGSGEKVNSGLADFATAWEAIKADLANYLSNETAVRVTISVQSFI